MSKHKRIIKNNRNSLFFVNNNYIYIYIYNTNLTENNKRFKYIHQCVIKRQECGKNKNKISKGAPSPRPPIRALVLSRRIVAGEKINWVKLSSVSHSSMIQVWTEPVRHSYPGPADRQNTRRAHNRNEIIRADEQSTKLEKTDGCLGVVRTVRPRRFERVIQGETGRKLQQQ